MRSVGLDLHRKRSHVAVIDDQGRELCSRRVINDGQSLLALLAEVDGECRVALEATYGWEWLAELLEHAGDELHLAHPLGTEAIASALPWTTRSSGTAIAALPACARSEARRRGARCRAVTDLGGHVAHEAAGRPPRASSGRAG